MSDQIIGYTVTVTATGATGRVVTRLAADNSEFDLFRIEFEDGSCDLFERDEFRQ